MKEKTHSFIQKIGRPFIFLFHKISSFIARKFPRVHEFLRMHKKKLLWIIPLIILLGYFMFKPKGIDPKTITVVPVEEKTLISTVKASGKITSHVDLELSFSASDTVRDVNVEVGQRVTKGTILATLQNQNELGAVTQAQGSLKSAQAALARTLEGATTEEVRVAEVLLKSAQTELKNTQNQQNIQIENAHRTLLSSSLQARPVKSFNDQTVDSPTVYGTYTGEKEGSFILEVYPSHGGYSFTVTGLSTASGTASVSNTVSIGHGISVQFPSEFKLGSNDTWVIDIPNKEGALYTTNLNTYMSVKATSEGLIASAQALVDQREAELALKKAEARPADVEARQADVLRAQGSLQSALGLYENTIIRAPASGVITKVDIKPGELSQSQKPVIVLQDVDNLYVEADINESNITTVKADQPVVFTIDAFGSDRTFVGTVTQVEPGATITDGIVNYKVKASLSEKDPLIKPGMNANLTITTGTKERVLAIPGASIEKKDDKQIARLITDPKKKKFKEVEVATGIIGDGNMTEILSGLSLGDQVALVEKTK